MKQPTLLLNVTIVFFSIIGLSAAYLPAQESEKSQSATASKTNSETKPTPKGDTFEIAMILTNQAAAWNEGNLVKFMDTYWKSDGLTFSGGGKTTRGWQATLDNYKRGYAPPKEMGQLHFDELNVMLIESNSALVIGNWHLKMKDDSKKDGNFSLVVKRIKGQWKIIHDHSSTLEPTDPKDSAEPKTHLLKHKLNRTTSDLD